jgi:aminopeptidase-like protein
MRDRRECSESMRELIDELYPLCRSITGDGVRRTLEILGRLIPIETTEVPSGTPAFDWTVPDEWNVRDAWIRGPDGSRVVDFRRHNLHLLNYSEPVHATLGLAELEPHLHSLPEQPDLIPYRTSYYRRTWGFCLPDRQRRQLAAGDYEVRIDSTLEPGHLTYGEHVVAGESDDEILVSCHVCHPSLANDNLSGIAVTTHLARLLARRPRRFTYRFLFIPGTIGSIVWLARNESRVDRIRGGLVAANLGDPGDFHYKRSRRGDGAIDHAVVRALEESGEPYRVEDFVPYGYDERQYCSPGFDLTVGSLTRTPYGRYPEYHTSADDLDFVHDDELAASLEMYLAALEILVAEAPDAGAAAGAEAVPVERAPGPGRILVSTHPRCEPQLGRRGLYGSLGGSEAGREEQLAMLWVLNLADGRHSLTDMARRSGLELATVERVAGRLEEAGLLVERSGERPREGSPEGSAEE